MVEWSFIFEHCKLQTRECNHATFYPRKFTDLKSVVYHASHILAFGETHEASTQLSRCRVAHIGHSMAHCGLRYPH